MCISSNCALETDTLVGNDNLCCLALEQIIQLWIEEWSEVIDIIFILWYGMWPKQLCHNWEDEFITELETKDLEVEKDEKTEKL